MHAGKCILTYDLSILRLTYLRLRSPTVQHDPYFKCTCTVPPARCIPCYCSNTCYDLYYIQFILDVRTAEYCLLAHTTRQAWCRQCASYSWSTHAIMVMPTLRVSCASCVGVMTMMSHWPTRAYICMQCNHDANCKHYIVMSAVQYGTRATLTRWCPMWWLQAVCVPASSSTTIQPCIVDVVLYSSTP